MTDAEVKIATLKSDDKSDESFISEILLLTWTTEITNEDMTENLIELNDNDDLHVTTSDSDYESLGHTLLSNSLSVTASFCDLSDEITLNDQHIDAAPADGVFIIISHKNILQKRISMIMWVQLWSVSHHSISWSLLVSKSAAHTFNYNILKQVLLTSADNIYNIFAEYDSFFHKNQTRQIS